MNTLSKRKPMLLDNVVKNLKPIPREEIIPELFECASLLQDLELTPNIPTGYTRIRFNIFNQGNYETAPKENH